MKYSRMFFIMWFASTSFLTESFCNEVQGQSNVQLNTQSHSNRDTIQKEFNKGELPKYTEENPIRREKISMTSQGLYVNYGTDEPLMPPITHNAQYHVYNDGDDHDDHDDNGDDDGDGDGDEDSEDDEEDNITDEKYKNIRLLEQHKLTQLLLLKELRRLKEENARREELFHNYKLRHSYKSHAHSLHQFRQPLLENELSNQVLLATQRENTNPIDKEMTPNEEYEQLMNSELAQNPVPISYQHNENSVASHVRANMKMHDVELNDLRRKQLLQETSDDKDSEDVTSPSDQMPAGFTDQASFQKDAEDLPSAALPFDQVPVGPEDTAVDNKDSEDLSSPTPPNEEVPTGSTDPSFNDDVSDYEKGLRAEMEEKIQKDTLAESKINQTTETTTETIHNKTRGIETNSTAKAFKNIDTLDKNKTFTSSKESKKRLTFLLDQLGNHVPTDKQRKKITMLKKKINQTSDNKIIQHLTNTSSNLLRKLKRKSFATKTNFTNTNTTASLKRTTVKSFRFHSDTSRTVSGIAKNKISTRLPRYKFIRPQRQFLFFSPVAVKYETNRKRKNLTSFLKHHERIKNRRKELTKSHHPRKKVDLSKHKDFIKKNYWNYLQFKQHIDVQPRRGFAEKKSVLV